MKKTKLLLGAVSLSMAASTMPIVLTSCGDNTAFTPTIEKDKHVTNVECSATKLNTAFSVSCTLKDGYEIDPIGTILTIGNTVLVNNQDYIIHENIIIVASAAVNDKNVTISIRTIDSATRCKVQLFVNEGGTLEGGSTSLEVIPGTKWKDITNKPTPTAKSGYKFSGWYRNETKITDDTVINEAMDIYAWFVKESGSQCYVTVIAAPGGTVSGSSILPVQSGTKWGNIKPTATPDSGYEFENWYMNDVKIDDDTIISSNSYVFAWFKSTNNKCKIKFECLVGGTFDETATTEIEITKGQTWADIKSQKPTPIQSIPGYVFKDWYVNKEETPVTDDTVFNEATYVFAYFEKENVTVTIDTTGVQHCAFTGTTADIIASNFNVARETLDAMVHPEEGYALAGWEDENGRIFDNYKVSTNKTIKPIIVEEYNTYDLNDTKGEATISGRVDGHDQTDLMIPSYIWKNSKSYKVTAIYFKDGGGYYMGSSTIKTLCIPNTISNIRDRAFCECSNLTTIYIPTSVTYFSYQCFYRTYKCTSFNYLGTIEQYKKIKNGGWWHIGMSAKTTVCIDGITNIDADI